MSNTNVKMVRGDTLAFALKVEFDEDVQTLDSAYFSCKSNYDDYGFIFQKSLSDGIEIVDSDEISVTYRVRVAPTDTKTLEPGNYFYDFQIGINHDVFTIQKGVLKIEKDMTY
mgnify:CR=1 FL=1